MKFNKTNTKKILRGNYIDALAFFAGMFVDCDEEDMEDAVNDVDTIVWEWVSEWGSKYEEIWLRVYSALLCAC